jgi:spore coat protein U-like protein
MTMRNNKMGVSEKIRITLLLILFTSFLALPAKAAQCNITATPLNFGSYDPLSAVPLTSTGSFNITCNPKKDFNITLQLAPGNSGSYALRTMTSGTGGSLSYNIYANAAQTSVLGDGSGGSVSLTQIVNRQSSWTVTFYGQVPALQNVVPGLYTDILTATILF